MLGNQRFREIEIKLKVPGLREIHKALRKLHARKISARTHELNTLYDTPAQDLRRLGRLTRIRVEHVAGNSKRKHEQGRTVLTYKAPVRSPRKGKKSTSAAAPRSRFKVKEEAEVSVTEAEPIDRILRGLGLRPTFHYEKYRTTYLLPGISDLKIELDETPVGHYLELEGSPASIDRAASLLGYAPADYVQATYGALYLAECRRRGRKPGHMLFPNTKNLR